MRRSWLSGRWVVCLSLVACGHEEPTAGERVAQADAALQGAVRSGSAYPEAVVVSMVFGAPWSYGGTSCAGALIAPNVVLTAGHCVAHLRAWTITAPHAGGAPVQAATGATMEWNKSPWATGRDRSDVGLLFLNAPIASPVYAAYNSSPPSNGPIVILGRINCGSHQAPCALDSIGKGDNSKFFNCGEGKILDPGDSGGPNFLGNSHTVVGVSSQVARDYADIDWDSFAARTDYAQAWIAAQVANPQPNWPSVDCSCDGGCYTRGDCCADLCADCLLPPVPDPCAQCGVCPPNPTDSELEGMLCPSAGGELCSESSACPDGYTNLGTSFDCISCCDLDTCDNDGACDVGESCANCADDCDADVSFGIYPPSPMVGQIAHFTASGGIDGAGPVLWDLGNATHLEGNPLDYAYPATGTYTVALTVTESGCHTTRIVESSVTVVEGAACSPDASPVPGQCGNCSCEAWAGETCITCATDCPQCCGDGSCDGWGGEDCTTCATDCGICTLPGDCSGGALPACGDDSCEPGVEDCGNCLCDCPCWDPANPVCQNGQCVPVPQETCNNQVCAGGEDCASCPEDCGTCPPLPGDCSGGTLPSCGDDSCAPGVEDCGNCLCDCPCWDPAAPVCNGGQCVPPPCVDHGCGCGQPPPDDCGCYGLENLGCGCGAPAPGPCGCEPCPPDPCANDPCCGDPCCGDPCCGDPCCGDPCCGDPCCGDPCCGDPCCGDPCCGDPCCGDFCCQNPEACWN
jgi:PKD repeat protein